MKKKQLFAMTALAVAITMTACGNSEQAADDNTHRVAVQFASTGTDAAQTRVSGANWEGNEIIGVYMVEHGTTNVAESAENIPYVTTSVGANATFTPFATDIIYYPVTTPAKVDFIAYYPRRRPDDMLFGLNVSNQSLQSLQSYIDLLWAKADNADAGYDKTQATPVNFAFTHRLAKLNLTVVAGTGVTSLTDLAVNIEGMYTQARFDIMGTGGFSNESAVASITPYVAGNNRYEAILLPVGTLGTGHLITFTIGDDVYTWNLSGDGGIDSGKLESGKKYDYTVTLQKHTLSVTGTIVDWIDGELEPGTGTAE
jgi:hypothetical protein